jgi:hypothetical protein
MSIVADPATAGLPPHVLPDHARGIIEVAETTAHRLLAVRRTHHRTR